MPSPIDLTTLALVKDEANVQSSTQDSIIQGYITNWSQAVLNETGIASFSQVQQFTETRNGNGNYQMFTRNRPIVNVAAVTVSGVAIPAAGVWPSWGYFVSDDQRSIWIRQAGSPVGFSYAASPNNRIPSTPGFSRGVGNVVLTYNAGFAAVPNDLEIASRRMIAVYYKRKQTLDLSSEAEAAGGTTATTKYRDWKVPPEVACVVDFYRRLAVI